jgi:hypothetical protein
VAIVVFAVLCTLAAWFAPAETEDPNTAMWYSVIPPVLAIVLAFLTRRVLPSLGIAILAGSLLSHVPRDPGSAAAWFEGFRTSATHVRATVTNPTYLQILAFVPPIFVMIEILIASGGFRGIIVWLLRWIRGRKSAQAATALMGILCFIDDYTNAIVVGSMMQPITDRFRISREKLAFIVDATSAPIAGLAVISTWIAYEVGLLGQIGGTLGIGKSGYAMFFDALSFRFYCLLMIAFVFVHIIMGRDFGPMKAAQERALAGAGTAGRTCALSPHRAMVRRNNKTERRYAAVANSKPDDRRRGHAGKTCGYRDPLSGQLGLLARSDRPRRKHTSGSFVRLVVRPDAGVDLFATVRFAAHARDNPLLQAGCQARDDPVRDSDFGMVTQELL